jgi:hypothetical protein
MTPGSYSLASLRPTRNYFTPAAGRIGQAKATGAT